MTMPGSPASADHAHDLLRSTAPLEGVPSGALAARARRESEVQRAEHRRELDATLDAIAERHGRRGADHGASVLLVGAGVVNLITALELRRAGFRVTVLDGGADPRQRGGTTGAARAGCTMSGDDARLFTLTEADQHRRRDDGGAGRSPAGERFRRSARDGGWSIRPAMEGPPNSETAVRAATHAWIDRHERMPDWLADLYARDLLACGVEAARGWAACRARVPSLFRGVEYRAGVLRIFSDAAHLDAEARRQEEVGGVLDSLGPEVIAARYPELAGVCAGGEVAGGLEVVGFSLGVHRFMARLVEELDRGGARLVWSARASAVRWSSDHRVEGIEGPDGLLRADHYVLSPGADGGALLEGTRASAEIHGVLGGWIRLPAGGAATGASAGRAIKIARRSAAACPGIAEDANILRHVDEAGREQLIVGAGYGYTGPDPAHVHVAELDVLFEAIESLARWAFPDAVSRAAAQGMLRTTRRTCVRPWTASSLGVFEVHSTTGGGGLVVTGAHNTGGFAQAPAVAEAVRDTLLGREHSMQWRYHPARLETALRHRAHIEGASTARRDPDPRTDRRNRSSGDALAVRR